jgi:hypothetical protein
MKKMIAKLLQLSVVILLSACAALDDTISGDPWLAYSGPPLSPDKVALIKTSGLRNFSGVASGEAYITRINDRAVEKFGGNIEALPGSYVLVVRVTNRLGGPGSLSSALTEKQGRGSITLEAEAGHVYIVNGKVSDGQAAILWIEDERTHEVVAGKKP